MDELLTPLKNTVQETSQVESLVHDMVNLSQQYQKAAENILLNQLNVSLELSHSETSSASSAQAVHQLMAMSITCLEGLLDAQENGVIRLDPKVEIRVRYRIARLVSHHSINYEIAEKHLVKASLIAGNSSLLMDELYAIHSLQLQIYERQGNMSPAKTLLKRLLSSLKKSKTGPIKWYPQFLLQFSHLCTSEDTALDEGISYCQENQLTLEFGKLHVKKAILLFSKKDKAAFRHLVQQSSFVPSASQDLFPFYTSIECYLSLMEILFLMEEGQTVQALQKLEPTLQQLEQLHRVDETSTDLPPLMRLRLYVLGYLVCSMVYFSSESLKSVSFLTSGLQVLADEVERVYFVTGTSHVKADWIDAISLKQLFSWVILTKILFYRQLSVVWRCIGNPNESMRFIKAYMALLEKHPSLSLGNLEPFFILDHAFAMQSLGFLERAMESYSRALDAASKLNVSGDLAIFVRFQMAVIRLSQGTLSPDDEKSLVDGLSKYPGSYVTTQMLELLKGSSFALQGQFQLSKQSLLEAMKLSAAAHNNPIRALCLLLMGSLFFETVPDQSLKMFSAADILCQKDNLDVLRLLASQMLLQVVTKTQSSPGEDAVQVREKCEDTVRHLKTMVDGMYSEARQKLISGMPSQPDPETHHNLDVPQNRHVSI